MRLMMIVDHHGLCQAKLWLSLVFLFLSLPRRPLPLPRCGCGKGNNRYLIKEKKSFVESC